MEVSLMSEILSKEKLIEDIDFHIECIDALIDIYKDNPGEDNPLAINPNIGTEGFHGLSRMDAAIRLLKSGLAMVDQNRNLSRQELKQLNKRR